jgi:hypothetical protein
MINRNLYDILIRHQLYVEGFKNYQKKNFIKELPKLVKDLKNEFKQVPYKILDEMTKRELNEFQRSIKKFNNDFFDFWNKQLIKELDAFLKADFYLTKDVLANYLNKENTIVKDRKENDLTIINKARKEDDNKIVPFYFVFDNEEEKLRKQIFNTLVPGVGTMPDDYLNSEGLNTLEKIQSKINSGFADKESVYDILDNVIGTEDNGFKDGIILSIINAQTIVQNTLIQQITSIIGASIFSTNFDRYQWISVMDSRTSDICIFRNLKIYYYGKGPLPPAHRRCRSHTMPYLGNQTPDESVSDWALTQSSSIQEYSKNLSPLNVEQFGSKLESILTV